MLMNWLNCASESLVKKKQKTKNLNKLASDGRLCVSSNSRSRTNKDVSGCTSVLFKESTLCHKSQVISPWSCGGEARVDKELGGAFALKASILKNIMTESMFGNKAWIQFIIQSYTLQSSGVQVQNKLFKSPGPFDSLVSHNSSSLFSLTRPWCRANYRGKTRQVE